MAQPTSHHSNTPSQDQKEQRHNQPARCGLVDELLGGGIIHPEDWHHLPGSAIRSILGAATEKAALELLLAHGLITEHQKGRIEAGTLYGLVLGNYRVLDRLGDGGMAVVFRAEHLDLRHHVAIKVLPVSGDQDYYLQSRFSSEMRTIAQLHHPNIVAALDAGRVSGAGALAPQLWYLVMELLNGLDLERRVSTQGPFSPARAVGIIHQIACALIETDRHKLVHRDIKPSNIMVIGEDVAKLLDFGLSRSYSTRLTEPGVVLGTVDFMAPEQARDARNVDIRADIYGLGGTLFWCLTGRLPFPGGKNLVSCLAHRLTAAPPSVRAIRPEIPAELDAVIMRMMATDPADRYPTPEAVIRALLPFIRPDRPSGISSARMRDYSNGSSSGRNMLLPDARPAVNRILVVDDEETVRRYLSTVLGATPGLKIELVEDGETALSRLAETQVDLVLLDADMPGISGEKVMHRLREFPPSPNLKIIIMSGSLSTDYLAGLLEAGADDFLRKPFSIMQLQRRVQYALRLKHAQDYALLLNGHFQAVNEQLERALTSNETTVNTNRDAIISSLSGLVAQRVGSQARHGHRMARYCRLLAEHASTFPSFEGRLTPALIATIEASAPLHDLGMVCLPDHILLKPGKLTPDERLLMQTHTTLGADVLRSAYDEHPGATGFLRTAIDIAERHHERWDGTGYPDRMEGADIPLPARIVALADNYDALRTRRSYKPAITHAAAVRTISDGEGQFDPILVRAFLAIAPEFERIYREFKD